MASIFPVWVQNVNTVASLVGFVVTVLGFGITIVVLLDVKRIKASFLSRARFPDMIKELEAAASSMSAHLGQKWPKERHHVVSHIKLAAAILKSASTMLPKAEREDILRTQKKLLKAADAHSAPEYADVAIWWDLYSDVLTARANIDLVLGHFCPTPKNVKSANPNA